MPYKKVAWKDRAVERPRTYSVLENEDETITLTATPGVVTEEGTPVNMNNMNHLEQGVYDAYYQSSMTFLTDAETTMVYTGEELSRIDERVNGVLRRRTNLYYTGDKLTSARTRIYQDNGITVETDYTDTLTYAGDNITKIERVMS